MKGLDRYKKKTLTGVLKRLSIDELEMLNKTGDQALKDAIGQVLLTKKNSKKGQRKIRKALTDCPALNLGFFIN